MNGNLFEALIGAVVLVVAGVFLVFAFTTADIGSVQGYQVVARFDRVDGLNIGSDVRLSGIKVGTVTSMELDHETFLAVVLMSVEPEVKLPKDSSAQIVTDGLLGGKFMAIVPGGDPDTIFCILQVVGDAPKVLRTERLRTVPLQSQKRTRTAWQYSMLPQAYEMGRR